MVSSALYFKRCWFGIFWKADHCDWIQGDNEAGHAQSFYFFSQKYLSICSQRTCFRSSESTLAIHVTHIWLEIYQTLDRPYFSAVSWFTEYVLTRQQCCCFNHVSTVSMLHETKTITCQQKSCTNVLGVCQYDITYRCSCFQSRPSVTCLWYLIWWVGRFRSQVRPESALWCGIICILSSTMPITETFCFSAW